MTIQETVQEFYRAYNVHDADALRMIIAEDAELVVPTTKAGKSIRGREAIVELERELFEKNIPDIHEEVFHIVIDGNIAAVEAQETGTVASTKGRYKTDYACIFHVNEHGLIDWAHSYWDTYPFAEQTRLPIAAIHADDKYSGS